MPRTCDAVAVSNVATLLFRRSEITCPLPGNVKGRANSSGVHVASEDVPATDDPNLTDAQARKLHQATRVQTRSSISAFMGGNVRRRWTMVRIVSQVLAFHNPDPNNPN